MSQINDVHGALNDEAEDLGSAISSPLGSRYELNTICLNIANYFGVNLRICLNIPL